MSDASRLVGHLAAWNYFQSVKSPENDAFVKMWADFNEQRDKTTNDPMEATFIGFRMWAQAVTQAGTTDVNAVRQAMYGQRIKAPSGFEVVMNTNHHLSKPAMIGKINSSGTFDVIWRSINPIRARSGAGTFPRAPTVRPIGHFPGYAADAPSRHSRNGDVPKATRPFRSAQQIRNAFRSAADPRVGDGPPEQRVHGFGNALGRADLEIQTRREAQLCMFCAIWLFGEGP